MKVPVSLVGAGPGDSDLWTLRAVRRLEEADLVVRDAAVDAREVRRYTRAPIVNVAASSGHREDARNGTYRRMIRTARAGKRVVRLLSPEAGAAAWSQEALALEAGGVPVEIVPGISSAIAVPELAGIPVTHRGVASGFVVLSDPSAESLSQVFDGIQPKGLSLVLLSDVSAGPAIARTLTGLGWGSATPAAVVWRESSAEQQVWSGSLARLQAGETVAVGRGVIVVGEVVHVRDALLASVAGVPDIEVQYGRH